MVTAVGRMPCRLRENANARNSQSHPARGMLVKVVREMIIFTQQGIKVYASSSVTVSMCVQM